jgi:Tfp pilus assembly protein PilF
VPWFIPSPQELPTRRPSRRLRIAGSTILVGIVSYVAWLYIHDRYGEPRQNWEAAQQAIETRDFPAALAHLDRCLEAWPGDAATLFLAARTARRAGDLDRAEEHLVRCRRLSAADPRTEPGDIKLEWALLQAERGRLNEVEAKLLAWLHENHVDSILILETLSWQHMLTGRFPDARRELDAWLHRQPDDYEALVRRAWVAEHPPFDFPSAIDGYERALSLQPERDAVRLRLAELLVERNLPKRALEHAALLYDKSPNDPAVILCLARCRRLLGDFAMAEQLLDALLTAQPDHPQALAERGVLAQQMGRLGEAERFLGLAVARDPYDRTINYHLSQILRRLGKNDEADKYKERVDQADADIHRIGSLMQNVARRPHDASLRYEVGMIFLRNGFTADAERWLSSAVREDPGQRPALKALADFYARAGNKNLAERYRRVLELLNTNHGPEDTVGQAAH